MIRKRVLTPRRAFWILWSISFFFLVRTWIVVVNQEYMPTIRPQKTPVEYQDV